MCDVREPEFRKYHSMNEDAKVSPHKDEMDKGTCGASGTAIYGENTLYESCRAARVPSRPECKGGQRVD